MRYSDRKEKAIPFIIIRLWPRHHTFKTDLNELLAALKANRQAYDEVWFCTEWGFPPMDAHERSARLMADATDAIRSLGIEPGIQIANTFGHGVSLLQDDSGAAWPMMGGPDGLASPTAPSGAKRNQYLAAADWVSRQTLPVICQTIAQVMVAPRLRPDGRLASVFLLNASIDSTTPLELRLRGVGRQKASWLTPENADRKLALIPDGKDYLSKTPSMRPWSVACIAFQ